MKENDINNIFNILDYFELVEQQKHQQFSVIFDSVTSAGDLWNLRM